MYRMVSIVNNIELYVNTQNLLKELILNVITSSNNNNKVIMCGNHFNIYIYIKSPHTHINYNLHMLYYYYISINLGKNKATMRYHYVSGRMDKIQNANTKCWPGCGASGTLIHCWWECKMTQPLWNTVGSFSQY